MTPERLLVFALGLFAAVTIVCGVWTEVVEPAFAMIRHGFIR